MDIPYMYALSVCTHKQIIIYNYRVATYNTYICNHFYYTDSSNFNKLQNIPPSSREDSNLWSRGLTINVLYMSNDDRREILIYTYYRLLNHLRPSFSIIYVTPLWWWWWVWCSAQTAPYLKTLMFYLLLLCQMHYIISTSRGGMLWPQTVTTKYHAKLRFSDKDRAIKGLAICNVIWPGSLKGMGLRISSRGMGLVPCCGQDNYGAQVPQHQLCYKYFWLSKK